MASILRVENVTKRFDGLVANDAVSLRIEAGEIVGLIGPNGSGKTTLFGSIAGAHPIDGGTVQFAGTRVSGRRMQEVARLGLLRTFQQPHVYAGMTCLENMRMSAPQREEKLHRILFGFPREVEERAEGLLAFVDLYAKRHVLAGDLSFGQQKLLEFVMALMSEPRLLLLDEPTAGINPGLINSMLDRLKRTNVEFGVTLLVIEHNMRVIMNLAERLYCLVRGRILAHGPPDTIRSDARVVEAYLGSSS